MLADKIVSTAWRLRRLVRVEAQAYDGEEQHVRAFSGYTGDRMLRIGRYEASLERALYRAMRELQRLQAARRGEGVPLPVADVTVSAEDESDIPEPIVSGLFRQNGILEIKPTEVAQNPPDPHSGKAF